MAEVFNLGLGDFALFHFDFKVVLAESVYNGVDVLYVLFGGLAINYDVVDVNEAYVSYESMQYAVH